jgi:hypothetical protein
MLADVPLPHFGAGKLQDDFLQTINGRPLIRHFRPHLGFIDPNFKIAGP